jgi:RNA polymerase sigma-70 factor (ECF subfamily)
VPAALESDRVFPEEPDESHTLLLLARAERGDEDAWRALYDRYHDQLLLWIRLDLGPGLRRFLQSEDIFQSVALEWFRDLRRFEYRGPGSLNRYLRVLVANKIRDRSDTFGAAKRGAPAPLEHDPADTEDVRYHDLRYERLEHAIAGLPDEMRSVVVWHKLEGVPLAEIAERLRKSDPAVRQISSRALAKLALALRDDGPASG